MARGGARAGWTDLGEVSAKNLGGPIQIARTSVQAARNGAETLWSLIAFLSLNIAILNLVPIPCSTEDRS